MWFVLALLSSVFAAATSILAKIGIEGVNSNLATAIRTAVVLLMAWGMVLAALILKEQFTPKSIFGCVLIAAGTLLMVL